MALLKECIVLLNKYYVVTVLLSKKIGACIYPNLNLPLIVQLPMHTAKHLLKLCMVLPPPYHLMLVCPFLHTVLKT